jgi:tetratricopeptide (TPR) repeat protein/tRNA A-37 threonylcarbamoyl transferase component Bud32
VVGTTIKDFRLVAPLGRGGMGEVWVAEQPIVKTRVAIKLLVAGVSNDTNQVQRFFNEAVAVGRIKHAGIAKIFDVGFHEGRAFLIMELMEGDALSTRLRGPRLPVSHVLDISRQIASVLAATHAAGVVHRDLKPDNIFLVPDAELPRGERAKVLDFGIAKLGTQTSMTAAGGSMGTPGYMAPEQWTDAAKADRRADIYALGCIIFEMACGRPPFVAMTLPEAYAKHMHEQPMPMRTLAPDMPTELEDLVLHMLAKRQEARPTMVAVQAVLARLLEGRTTQSIAVQPMGPTMPATAGPVTTLGGAAAGLASGAAPKRRRWAVAVGALVVAGGATTAIALAMRGNGDEEDRGAHAANSAVAAPAQVVPADAAAVHTPKLGLDTIERFRLPTSSAIEDLHSETLWTNARDDLKQACAPGAPVRWCSGADFAAAEIAVTHSDNLGAIVALRHAIEHEPDWAVPYVALAGELSDQGDPQGALDAARTAQRLDPTWWQAVAAGARAYSAARKGDEAIQEFRRALALAPNNAVLIAEIALAYHAAGNDSQADKYADQALALDDGLVSIHVLRAERALEKRDADTAEREAEHALATAPKNAAAHLARGDARALRNDRDGAFADYREVVKLVGDRVTGVPTARLEIVKAALASNNLPPPRGRTLGTSDDERSRPTRAPSNPVNGVNGDMRSRPVAPPSKPVDSTSF